MLYIQRHSQKQKQIFSRMLSLCLLIFFVQGCAAQEAASNKPVRTEATIVSDELKPTNSMPMWYYSSQHIFKSPIPCDFDFAYIDESGNLLMTGPFAIARESHHSVAIAKIGTYQLENGKWSYQCADPSEAANALLSSDRGVELTPKIREFTDAFYDQLAVASVAAEDSHDYRPTYELADRYGQVFTKNHWTEAKEFSEGLAAVKAGPNEITTLLKSKVFAPDGLWGYCTADGKFVMEPQFSSAGRFSEGLAAVCKTGFKYPKPGQDPRSSFRDEDFSYIDQKGTVKIAGPFMDARPFSNGLAAVMRDSKWGYIDKSGNATVPFRYGWAGNFEANMAPVELNGLVGFIDKDGKTVIPFKFKNAKEFGQMIYPVAPATIDGKTWGYIDKSGEFSIKPQFQQAFPFSDKCALVCTARAKEIPSKVELKMFYLYAANLRQNGRVNLARAACRRIFEVDNNSEWATKGRNLLKTGLPDYDISPAVAEKYEEGGRLAGEGKLDQAEQTLREALKLDPRFFLAAGSLSYILDKKEQHAETIELIKAALVNKPDYARGYWRLAKSYKALDKAALSAENLAKARQLDPDDPVVMSDP
jgi:tetratricopeptide (TPR) repeat protein